MIAWAVLEGQLPESVLTAEEVAEIVCLVQQAVMDKKMQELADAGGSVFWGVDGGDVLH